MLKGTDKYSTEPCHVLTPWMNEEEGRRTDRHYPCSEADQFRGREAENLKTETLKPSMPWEVLEPKGTYMVWKLLRKNA